MSRPRHRSEPRGWQWLGGLAWLFGWPMLSSIPVYWPYAQGPRSYSSFAVTGGIALVLIGVGGWLLRPEPNSDSPALDGLSRIAWLFFCLGMGIGITPGFGEGWTPLFGLCLMTGCGLGVLTLIGRVVLSLQRR